MNNQSSTFQEISNSPLNTSMTKQLFSFGKQSRFDKLENPSQQILYQKQQNHSCSQASYSIPQSLSKRGTSLGYGSKSDLAKVNCPTPAPNNYKIRSEFEIKLDQHKGFQFGVSREVKHQYHFFSNQKMTQENPGPGKYDTPSSLSNLRYTLRAKTDDNTLILNKFVPGPGTYTTLPALTEKGTYSMSKFKNSGACFINPKSKRFQDEYSTDVPGPGNYNLNSLGIQKDGKYFINGFNSTPARFFPKFKRQTGTFENVEITPGPGTYRLPSDFGYYDAMKNKLPVP